MHTRIRNRLPNYMSIFIRCVRNKIQTIRLRLQIHFVTSEIYFSQMH